MKSKTKALLMAIGSVGLFLLLTRVSFADVPTDNAITSVRTLFEGTAHNWSFILTVYAARIFWILALIDFAWMAIGLALNPGEFSDITANLIRKILFIGFFWMLVQPVGAGPAGGQARGIQWATDIVNSMIQAAGQANNWAGGTSNISPGLVFDTGYSLCAQIYNAVSLWSPAESIALTIGAIVIMVCFSLISAMMLLMYVQSYIIIYAGVILLGFGGSVFTKDIALNYFKAALSVGAKLFTMILIVGLGQTILDQWTANFNVGLEQIALFIGAAIVLLALVKAIPDMVGDMINGFSWGSGDSLIRSAMQVGKGTVGTGAALATAGAVATGGYMAIKEAAKVSGATNSGFGSKVAGTVSNLSSAAIKDTSGRLSGQHPGHGTKGGRMAAILKESGLTSPKKEEIKDEPYINNVPNQNKTGSIYKDKK